jgi:hypothetical protein
MKIRFLLTALVKDAMECIFQMVLVKFDIVAVAA